VFVLSIVGSLTYVWLHALSEMWGIMGVGRKFTVLQDFCCAWGWLGWLFRGLISRFPVAYGMVWKQTRLVITD